MNDPRGNQLPSSGPRFGTGALVSVLVVGLALGVAASWVLGHRHGHGEGVDTACAQAEPAKPTYVCPMHPRSSPITRATSPSAV